jgi:hypothetical protein
VKSGANVCEVWAIHRATTPLALLFLFGKVFRGKRFLLRERDLCWEETSDEESLQMHCYLCLIDGRGEQRSACAICQRCGAGVCEKHLVTQTSTAPIGMAGNGKPRYLLTCQRCSSDLGGIAQSTRSPGVPHQIPLVDNRRWWLRPRKKRTDLPDPQAAIAGVERFLKKQRRQE